jgi:O-antigen/teichoic acid export membrane protein
MLLLIMLSAPWLAGSWLNVRVYPEDRVATIIRLMAVSVSFQFISAFYLNALAGLQRMGVMNAVQIFNNTLRYLGGAAVLAATDGIFAFFAFQAAAAGVGMALARWNVARIVGGRETPDIPAGDAGSLRRFMVFSGGMFFTAASGALLSNADRIVVSRMMSAEVLGKYTVALTAIGLLQTVIFAFHRAYFPRFSELNAAGDPERLKHTYYDACTLVGSVVIPVALVFAVFTPELFTVWLGWTEPDTVTVSRLLVLGFVLSGVMWLPAAYQQAIGWTRLHASLMAVTLVGGVPLLVLCVDRIGLIGASALMITHGVIEITLGLWLMNRVCFPGENMLWYRRVIGGPLLWSLPVVALSWVLMPHDLSRPACAAWILVTCATLALVGALDDQRRRSALKASAAGDD